MQPGHRGVQGPALGAEAREAIPGTPGRERAGRRYLAAIGGSPSTWPETVEAQLAHPSGSKGATIRIARSGGQPRSASSISAWRSERLRRRRLRRELVRESRWGRVGDDATRSGSVSAPRARLRSQACDPSIRLASTGIDRIVELLAAGSGSRRRRPPDRAVLPDAGRAAASTRGWRQPAPRAVGDCVDVAAGPVRRPGRHPDRLGRVPSARLPSSSTPCAQTRRRSSGRGRGSPSSGPASTRAPRCRPGRRRRGARSAAARVDDDERLPEIGSAPRFAARAPRERLRRACPARRELGRPRRERVREGGTVIGSNVIVLMSGVASFRVRR